MILLTLQSTYLSLLKQWLSISLAYKILGIRTTNRLRKLTTIYPAANKKKCRESSTDLTFLKNHSFDKTFVTSKVFSESSLFINIAD